MRDWLRRLGRLCLAAAEVGLAGVVLFAVAVLGDIQAGVRSGQYAQEPASGFVVGFAFLWIVASLALLASLAGHAAGWTLLAVDGADDLAVLRRLAARIGVELVVSIGLFILADGTVPAGAFDLLLDGSVVLSTLVLVHVAVNTVQFARGLVSAG